MRVRSLVVKGGLNNFDVSDQGSRASQKMKMTGKKNPGLSRKWISLQDKPTGSQRLDINPNSLGILGSPGF